LENWFAPCWNHHTFPNFKYWIVTIDVVSSDIYDEDQEKHDYTRSISRINTVMFR
jgi:hypothetical protein